MSIQILGLGLVVLGLILGGLFLLLARQLRARVEAARQWTEVAAVIQTARLMKVGKTSWAPGLTYSYSVGGKSYTGKRLQFSGVSLDKEQAEAILAVYPEGAATTVRYDPQKHEFAVLRLEGDTRGLVIAAVALASVFCFTGLLVALTG